MSLLHFSRKNYLERIVPTEEHDRDIKSFTARYKAALHASDQGDLIVELPQGVTVQESNDVPLSESEKVGNGESHHVIRTHLSFSPLVVRVYYQLVKPHAGVYFVLPTDGAYARRMAHMYTHNQEDNGARAWMPTVDHVSERCTWEFEITVGTGLVAVASGELLEQVWADDEETKKTFFYKQSVAVPARAVALTVGPFAIYPDPRVPSITHFCTPGRLKDLQHTVDFLGKAHRFYEEYLQMSFPFESYKQVFVEDAYCEISSYASLSICASHLLHDETIIDQTLVTRRHLALALAQQWFQCYVGVKSWPDMWISAGLSSYLANLFFRRMFGNNEYKYCLLMESEWVCANDNGPPLYNEHAAHPHDMQTELVARKSPLVVYMIERRVGETSFRKLLNGLVALKPATGTDPAKEPTTPREANGVLSNNNNNGNTNNSNNTTTPSIVKDVVDQTLSTKKLLKTIKLETGQDMKSFAEKWIFGKGCPKLACGFWFNRKRHHTEFALRQLVNKPEDRISSSLTIRIRELEGSYDNVIHFDDEMHAYEFPCYSRVRKSRKKKNEDEKEEIPVPQLHGTKKTETPLSWVRVDPDMEWIHNITFRQPEYMWIRQLEEDRDVIAQREAVRGLQCFATSSALKALKKIVDDPDVFYRVRMEAAYSLSSSSSSSSSSSASSGTEVINTVAEDVHWVGLEYLLRTFKNLFYNKEGTQLLPNSFADFCNYHLQKMIPMAMAHILDKDGRTPSDVLEFLLDLLKNNDNSHNAFSDNYYVESVIHAVSKTKTLGFSDPEKIAKQIHRYLNMERLMPSYHNTITVACIKALGDLQCSRKLDATLQTFKEYMRYGHFDEVRFVAISALTRLAFTHPTAKDSTVADKLLAIAESDPSYPLRARVLEVLASPVSPADERAYFNSLHGHLDRIWELVNGPLSALDSRTRGAALRLHHAVLTWGKHLGLISDTPSTHTQIRKQPKIVMTAPSVGGVAGGASKGQKKVKNKRKHEDEPPFSSEPLKIRIFQKTEPTPSTTSHPPPTSSSTSSTTTSSQPITQAPPPATTPPSSASANAKRRKHNTPPSKPAAATTSPPHPPPSLSSSTSTTPIKEEAPVTPPHQPKTTKRTTPSSQQPLSQPPPTPSVPPTPTPIPSIPPPSSTPAPTSTSTTPATTSSTPSTPAAPTTTTPAPGSLKIKLKLGGVHLKNPENK